MPNAIRSFLTASFAAGVLLSLAAAPSTPPATVLQNIAQRLGSPDFKIREAAQKDLDKITYHQRDQILRLAQQSTNPEIKARLTLRLDQIDEQLAIDPPPISLDLDNATLEQTAAALTNALGPPIHFDIKPFQTSTLFTLHAKDQPFWKIFAALNTQNPISFSDAPFSEAGQFELEVPKRRLRTFQQVGPFVIVPGPIDFTDSIDLPSPPAPANGQVNPRLYFRFQAITDPRVPIIALSNPRILHMEDDAGNILFTGKPDPSTDDLHWSEDGHLSDGFAFMNIPKNPGKRITLLTGDIHIQIAVSQQKLQIPDLEKALHQPLNVGSRTVHISSLTIQPNDFDIQTSIENVDSNTVHDVRGMTMTVYDADNKVVFPRVPIGGSAGATKPYRKPLHATIDYPTKTKDFSFTFQFKDLPLPHMPSAH